MSERDELAARLWASGPTPSILAVREAASLLERDGAELDRLCAELETERTRLAACGVAAMANTPSTVAQRITRDNPYWSASYGDVCAAVDREMALRAEVARLTDEHKRGTAALRVAFGEELWRLGHPAYVVVHLREELEKITRLWKSAAVENDALLARVEAAEKDAARYREALRKIVDAHERNTLYSGAGHWNDARAVLAQLEKEGLA